MRRVIPIAAALALTGCDTTNYAAKQEASTPAAPVVVTEIVQGSRIALRVPLDLPGGRTPLLLQNNAIVAPSQLVGVPYCRFAGATPQSPRAVKPVTFTVRDIDYDERQAVDRKLANVTHYRLAAASKTPGYVLSCQWPDGAPSGAFVTAGDVQTAIGAFFTLVPAQ